MKTFPWRILERVPDLKTQIIDRLATDPDFRSLCQDYGDCAAALHGLRDQAGARSARVGEYEQLMSELEDDIRRMLNQD